MGFALGEGEKPGEVTRKCQVLSLTQLLPFSTECVFLKCFQRFSWCQSVRQVAGTGPKPAGKGGPELLFFSSSS